MTWMLTSLLELTHTTPDLALPLYILNSEVWSFIASILFVSVFHT